MNKHIPSIYWHHVINTHFYALRTLAMFMYPNMDWAKAVIKITNSLTGETID